MRENIVGTHWLWVTLYSSIACRACAGSKRGMYTTVPPSDCAVALNPRGAA